MAAQNYFGPHFGNGAWTLFQYVLADRRDALDHRRPQAIGIEVAVDDVGDVRGPDPHFYLRSMARDCCDVRTRDPSFRWAKEMESACLESGSVCILGGCARAWSSAQCN